MTTKIGSTVLGYPRIGRNRELKHALESYWRDTIGETELRDVARGIRVDTWRGLAEAGLESIPSNTFSFYDQMLDTAVMVGAVPRRFSDLGLSSLDTYFAMARGRDSVLPLEMTKWFDTNYHYLVPEVGPNTRLSLSDRTPIEQYREAAKHGFSTRPVLIGPLTFLLLSKSDGTAPDSFAPLDKLDDLLEVYTELLGELHDAGVQWVQLDEPAFTADRHPEEVRALRRSYRRLADLNHRPRILAASYYGYLGDTLEALASCDIEAIGLDFVSSKSTVERLFTVSGLREKTLVAGLVDGRNVWRTDTDSALTTAATLLGVAEHVVIGTSCSLMHVPYDVEAESSIDPQLRAWLAFAEQKVREVVVLNRALHEGREVVADELSSAQAATENRAQAESKRNDQVRQRLRDLTRADRIDHDSYRKRMRTEIESVVRLQEDIGLDVLVHGEPERNDMVQYFAEHLDGIATTDNGWVQSYGSRCVRPPILYGDVSRPNPITVEWSRFTQELTTKPVKGMLTGPVTILAWSFVRDDQPLADTARQVALAIRDEAIDLESAGIGIVQVDEAALRELLPLRAESQEEYLDWAVESFRLATSGVADDTQIHTHLCYSEFGDVIDAIVALDADVTSIEAARSKMEVLDDLNAVGFARGLGPGVYDIHSPNVPGQSEISTLLGSALEVVPAERLWVNPDCGLKTRGYTEIEPALRNMVNAVREFRESSVART